MLCPILQVRRQGQRLAKSHMTSKRQSWDSGLALLLKSQESMGTGSKLAWGCPMPVTALV